MGVFWKWQQIYFRVSSVWNYSAAATIAQQWCERGVSALFQMRWVALKRALGFLRRRTLTFLPPMNLRLGRSPLCLPLCWLGLASLRLPCLEFGWALACLLELSSLGLLGAFDHGLGCGGQPWQLPASWLSWGSSS